MIARCSSSARIRTPLFWTKQSIIEERARRIWDNAFALTVAALGEGPKTEDSVEKLGASAADFTERAFRRAVLQGLVKP